MEEKIFILRCEFFLDYFYNLEFFKKLPNLADLYQTLYYIIIKFV